MISLTDVPRTTTTTAPAAPAAPRTLFVGLFIAGLCTTSSAALRLEEARWYRQPNSQTAAGVPPWTGTLAPVRTSAELASLRRVSGLTWEQLASLFGVSRRALHFWASGEPMTIANDNRLRQLLQLMVSIDRGAAIANRVALLRQDRDGVTPLALLIAGDNERAVRALRAGSPVGPAAGSVAAQPERRLPRPPAPSQLVQAEQASIHTDLPGGRAVRTTKRRGA